MVDIDEVAVDICREQLPEWGDGAADDPRLKLFYTDAYAWLDRDDEATGTFDIIVMDIADPIEAGPGMALTRGVLRAEAAPPGRAVTQSGPGGSSRTRSASRPFTTRCGRASSTCSRSSQRF